MRGPNCCLSGLALALSQFCRALGIPQKAEADPFKQQLGRMQVPCLLVVVSEADSPCPASKTLKSVQTGLLHSLCCPLAWQLQIALLHIYACKQSTKHEARTSALMVPGFIMEPAHTA